MDGGLTEQIECAILLSPAKTVFPKDISLNSVNRNKIQNGYKNGYLLQKPTQMQ